MNKGSEKFYNQFSVFYPLVEIFLIRHKRVLFREINQLPYGNLLEIGVGNGRHLNLYKNHAITGIDTSLSMLKIARRKMKEGIVLEQMSGESLSFNDHSFDYVVLSHVLAVVNNPEKLLDEVYRVLKVDGSVFILNHFTPNTWLKHVDQFFQFFSRLFYFNAVFHISQLNIINKFTLLKEISFGKHAYFKLLIYKRR